MPLTLNGGAGKLDQMANRVYTVLQTDGTNLHQQCVRASFFPILFNSHFNCNEMMFEWFY